jgi:hypothetical protein
MMRMTVLAFVPLGGLLAGCGTQHPTASELKAVPGAMASYPGSVAVGGHGPREGEHTLWSSSSAVIVGTFCAAASQREVTHWFASELGRDGWVAEPNPVVTTATDVVATEEWRHGRRTFTMQWMSPAYVGRLSTAHGLACSSSYRVFVQ